jgi:hypothetical protein
MRVPTQLTQLAMPPRPRYAKLAVPTRRFELSLRAGIAACLAGSDADSHLYRPPQ